jgi:hypothetical protein
MPTTKFKINETKHSFKKVNLITLQDRRGQYDKQKCAYCGLEGKIRMLGEIEITYRKEKDYSICPKAPSITKIFIINCTAFGRHFANITPGSEHEVIPAPFPNKDDEKGVWVMGAGAPVKILNQEYKTIS